MGGRLSNFVQRYQSGSIPGIDKSRSDDSLRSAVTILVDYVLRVQAVQDGFTEPGDFKSLLKQARELVSDNQSDTLSAITDQRIVPFMWATAMLDAVKHFSGDQLMQELTTRLDSFEEALSGIGFSAISEEVLTQHLSEFGPGSEAGAGERRPSARKKDRR